MLNNFFSPSFTRVHAQFIMCVPGAWVWFRLHAAHRVDRLLTFADIQNKEKIFPITELLGSLQ